MNELVLKLGLALICFGGRCEPVLYGADTPAGVYELAARPVEQAGYEGEVLQFKEDAHFVWAIHRVWTGNPAEMRTLRLRTQTPNDNKITNGCINVSPETYVWLRDCCDGATFRIEQ